MNFFKKLKSFLPIKITGAQKEKEKEKEEDIFYFILHKLTQQKRNLSNKPPDLNEKEWLDAVNIMIFAFSAKKNNRLKSRARSKRQQPKIQKGFMLFQRYIKYL
jgi:hypothetical protein